MTRDFEVAAVVVLLRILKECSLEWIQLAQNAFRWRDFRDKGSHHQLIAKIYWLWIANCSFNRCSCVFVISYRGL